jgi:carbonic anhydrase/acetyltransferase-like protein (isoleucine patch superfamily)
LIGEIEIGANCSIWFSTVLRGDGPGIRIGENPNLQEGPVAMSPRAAVVTTIGCGGESQAMVAAGAVVMPRKIVRCGKL